MLSKNLFDVSGKIALVTGSTGGLGSVFAEGLAKNGATVILNGRNKQKLDKKVAGLKAQNLDVYGFAFDITNSAEIQKALDEISKTIGNIDILVNNAGINLRAPLENFTDDDWDTIVATNLTGAFKMAKAVAKGMIGQGAGKIINIGSVQSEISRQTIAPYTATKGGIKNLTKGMAVDWAKYNIQINGIGPGYFKTEMTQPLYEDPEFDKWLCNRTPANRWGNPEELIGVLLFLSSEASNYVNGQMIYVDGGLLSGV